MPSIRNTENRVLEAVRYCVTTFGISRTTLADVARRAGVSRPTVYRTWPDVTSLVADALTRELRDVFEECRADPDGGDARRRLVTQCAGVVAALREHPLFARVIDTEPELLATYTFHRLGTSQRVALELLREQIRDGQRDGSIVAGDPEALARIVLLTVQSMASSWRLTTDVLSLEGLTTELRALLDGYLSPEGRA